MHGKITPMNMEVMAVNIDVILQNFKQLSKGAYATMQIISTICGTKTPAFIAIT